MVGFLRPLVGFLEDSYLAYEYDRIIIKSYNIRYRYMYEYSYSYSYVQYGTYLPSTRICTCTVHCIHCTSIHPSVSAARVAIT